jgi:hypothetical protein
VLAILWSEPTAPGSRRRRHCRDAARRLYASSGITQAEHAGKRWHLGPPEHRRITDNSVESRVLILVVVFGEL